MPETFADWSAFERSLADGRIFPPGIHALRIDQEHLIAKVADGDGRPYGRIRATLVGLLIRVFLGHRADRSVLRRTHRQRLAHEASRLRSLQASGQAVPAVRLHRGCLLIMQDVGQTIDGLLTPLDQGERLALIETVAADLAAFHAEGFWHGASQLRNLTHLDGRVYRIDFEEDLEGIMPLAQRQALDLLLAAFSLAHHRGITETGDRVELIRRLVGIWRERMDATPAGPEFGRMGRLIGRFRRPGEWLRPVKGRDVVAFRVLIQGLASP